MNSKISIEDNERSEIQKILRRFLKDGVQIYAFGSRTGESHNKYADLDLCIKEASSDPPIDSSIVQSIKECFAESSIPFKVDVSFYRDLPASFQKEIDENGIKFL